MSMINKVLFIGSKPLGLRCLRKIYELSPESLDGIMNFVDAWLLEMTYYGILGQGFILLLLYPVFIRCSTNIPDVLSHDKPIISLPLFDGLRKREEVYCG